MRLAAALLCLLVASPVVAGPKHAPKVECENCRIVVRVLKVERDHPAFWSSQYLKKPDRKAHRLSKYKPKRRGRGPTKVWSYAKKRKK